MAETTPREARLKPAANRQTEADFWSPTCLGRLSPAIGDLFDPSHRAGTRGPVPLNHSPHERDSRALSSSLRRCRTAAEMGKMIDGKMIEEEELWSNGRRNPDTGLETAGGGCRGW